jgi:prepilin-type processing-associated H-X9-DG protein
VAAVLGLLAVPLALVPFGGLLALAVGFFSLRMINTSDGRLWGRPFAVAAMVLGALGTVFFLVFGSAATVVMEMRAKADRAGCENNLREIGLAVNAYHDEHKEYPSATVGGAGLPPEQRLSWLAGLLPYLGDVEKKQPARAARVRSLADALHPEKGWAAAENREAVHTPLREFLCPASPDRGREGNPGITHYVGFAGAGADAARLPADDPDAGFFGYDRTLTRDKVQELRGQSTLLMAAETGRDNGPWAAGGPPTVRGVDPAERPWAGYGRPFGGLHRGGLNVLWADASVAFMNDTYAGGHLDAMVRLRPEP